MTRNQIEYWKLQEDKRSNQARETETHRANFVNEGLTRTGLAETGRHNRATEGEQHRTNVANELLKQQSVNTEKGKLAEQQRSNKAQEALASQRNTIQSQANKELARHNLAGELLTNKQLSEVTRHNRMDEGIRIGSKAADVGVNLLGTLTRYDLGKARNIQYATEQAARQIPQTRRLALPG